MNMIKTKGVFFLVLIAMLFTAISAEVPDTFCESPVITAASAKSYTLGTTVDAAIDENGEVDIYTIEVTDRTNIEIYTQGKTDTFGTLTDRSGNVIAEDDDSHTDKNFIIIKLLSPGLYTLEIRDYYDDRVGEYTLQSTFSTASSDKVGNSIDEAFPLNPDTAALDGAVDYAGDVDFFKISVTRRTTITANTQGDTDTFGTFHDASGQILAEDDDSNGAKNFILCQSIGPGTYYLCVRNYYPDKWGAYQLTVMLDDQDDDFGNGIKEASFLTMNQPIDAAVDYPDDRDCFGFTVKERGTVEISTQGDTDTYGILMDSNGTELIADDDSGDLKNFHLTKFLSPGTYYILIKDYYPDLVGVYTLSSDLAVVFEDSYGDDIASASEILPDSKVDGYIDEGGDIDFFKFVLEERKNVKIHTTGRTDTFGILYDRDGKVLCSHDDTSDTDKNFTLTRLLDSGTYYVSVKAYYDYSSGSYSMLIQTDNAGVEQTEFELDAGDANTCAFAYDSGNYAYVGCNVTPARIVKYDIMKMKRVSSMDLPAGENRDQTRVAGLIAIGPDTLIHASFTNPCVFTRIDGNTMTITGTLQGVVEDVNDKYIRALAFDGRYVYAATYSTPVKIIKIDPVTMTRVDAVTFEDRSISCCFAITLCGDYLVGACEEGDAQGAVIFRISLADIHQAPEIIQVPGVSQYHSICTDGRSVYAATDTDPIRVVKIDAQATPMHCAAVFTGEEGLEAGNFTIAYDGTSVVAGTWNFKFVADRFIKLDKETLTREDTMDCPSKFPSDLIYIGSYFYTSSDHPRGIVNRFKFE